MIDILVKSNYYVPVIKLPRGNKMNGGYQMMKKILALALAALLVLSVFCGCAA